MLTTRERLHRLIDELPDQQLPSAERYLESLHPSPNRRKLLRVLAEAPIDDEPETPDEAAAVAKAMESAKAGRVISDEEFRREFNL